MNKSSDLDALTETQDKNKSSYWWILYHSWGGVCLMLYIEVSGITNFALSEISSSASATTYANLATMIMVSAIVIGFLLSKFLVKVINQSFELRKDRIALKVLLPFGFFLAAVSLSAGTAPLISEHAHTPENSTNIAIKPNEKSVMAFSTSQSSEGISESDLDESFLISSERWIVESMLEKGRNHFSEMGYNPKNYNPEISTKSVYMHVDGKKLAIIKISTDNSLQSVTIIGINGSKLVRVSCVHASNQDIPVWSGMCGSEIQKSFGVKVQS